MGLTSPNNKRASAVPLALARANQRLLVPVAGTARPGRPRAGGLLLPWSAIAALAARASRGNRFWPWSLLLFLSTRSKRFRSVTALFALGAAGTAASYLSLLVDGCPITVEYGEWQHGTRIESLSFGLDVIRPGRSASGWPRCCWASCSKWAGLHGQYAAEPGNAGGGEGNS